MPLGYCFAPFLAFKPTSESTGCQQSDQRITAKTDSTHKCTFGGLDERCEGVGEDLIRGADTGSSAMSRVSARRLLNADEQFTLGTPYFFI